VSITFLKKFTDYIDAFEKILQGHFAQLDWKMHGLAI